MERELPTINIDGTEFLFDIEQLALVEKNRPEERKLFFDEMNDRGTHYDFVYNRNSRRLDLPRTLDGMDAYITGKHSFATIEVPRIGDIDPLGMCKKYGCSFADVTQKSDFEIMVDQEKFHRRMEGELVTIDFPNKRFVLDMPNNLLRPQDGIGMEISFDEIEKAALFSNETNAYYIIYNIANSEIIKSDLQISSNENAIVEILHPLILDPIGYNILLELDPKRGLIDAELKFNHEATFIPWREYNQVFDKDQKKDSSLDWKILSPLMEKARKYKDVELPIKVDQHAFDMRVNKGILPTIDIAGHTFFVDLQKDKLRPKDDFLSKGIVFSDIASYYDEDKRSYTIPYNPKTHEFQEPDYLNIKEHPIDLIAVEFPYERLLDRIGWNRKYGFDITHGLDKTGLTLQFTARPVTWQETFLAGLIESNRKNDNTAALKRNASNDPAENRKQKRGRGM